MNRKWIETRQTKYATYITIYVLVILCIVTVANVLASRYNKSFDATANKRYSLSDQTAKILKGVTQPISITYFDRATAFQTGKDLLDRYATLSPKIKLNYVDPGKDPQAARAAGVDKYGTTVVQIGAKKELAKAMTEEEVTGAIIHDLKSNSRNVCFLTGSGEHLIDDADRQGMSHFKDMLAKDDYTSKAINLIEKPEIPEDCTVVVAGGPKNDYPQPEVDALKKFVEGGGRAMFLLDPPLKVGRGIADNDALNTVLQGWGVTADKDLLLDLSPVGQLFGAGPTLALVLNYDPHPIVDSLKGTTTGFQLARSLTVKNTDKSTVQKLFESSDSSLATSKLDSPEINPKDPGNKPGPLTIAAAGTYTTGKEKSEGRFVVVGNSSWVSNNLLSFNGNGDLALNAMNWLSSDEDLISIRPKPEEDRKVSMTQKQYNWVLLSSQFLLPGALLLAGLSVWWRRR